MSREHSNLASLPYIRSWGKGPIDLRKEGQPREQVQAANLFFQPVIPILRLDNPDQSRSFNGPCPGNGKLKKPVTDRAHGVYSLSRENTIRKPASWCVFARGIRALSCGQEDNYLRGQTGLVVSARFVPRPLLSSRSSNLRNVSASGACTAAPSPPARKTTGTLCSLVEIRFDALGRVLSEERDKEWVFLSKEIEFQNIDCEVHEIQRKSERRGEIENETDRFSSEQNNDGWLGVDNTGKCKSQYANASSENVCLTER
ncbi:hypothetical protein K0M31_005796 [Melipona bicolor]|uniref:Uncharacterized protein n=1 Tax=Melipona bicolor TaxID=60889 RepID=A0AA40KM11_9HYME|nr:hypothetical protein K0M31_005796 [Melipona bicolor]